MDTIFAVASSIVGKSGVAVIRVSGPHALASLRQLTGLKSLPAPRKMTLVGALRNPETRERVDRDALVCRFNAPHSFTGEHVVEYHCHGSRAVASELLSSLALCRSHRLAAAGEFARRAFHNNKMNLIDVESLVDLIDSDTAAQRRAALRQLDGGLASQCDAWRQRVVGAMAHAEAVIDFGDDEDIGESEVLRGIRPQIGALADDVGRQLAESARSVERVRDGARVAIAGPPNAGKSSLLNALARRDVAIVSEHAGTTRDVIEVALDLAGYPLTLSDTAGLHDDAAMHPVERQGIERTLSRIDNADLCLCMVDCAQPTAQMAAELDATLASVGSGDRMAPIVVLNKRDLIADESTASAIESAARRAIDGSQRGGESACLFASTRTGDGIDGIVDVLTDRVRQFFDESQQHANSPILTRTRHRLLLERTLEHLRSANEQESIELVAESLRQAAVPLGQISGRIYIDDVLDSIFSQFCIGK
jgi:tRNA modification GTPase